MIHPRETLERSTKRLLDYYDEYGLDEGIIDATRELLGLIHRLTNSVCSRCGCISYRSYEATSTWRGGIGGQVITAGICDYHREVSDQIRHSVILDLSILCK